MTLFFIVSRETVANIRSWRPAEKKLKKFEKRVDSARCT